MFRPSASGRASLLLPDGARISHSGAPAPAEGFHLPPRLVSEQWTYDLCHAVLSHFSPVTHQVSLSMVFSRQECWTGLPCPPPGDLPDPGTEPMSPALQADSLPLSHQGSLWTCDFHWSN